MLRAGTYKWDGVLVVQKHMHVRGEPNPDEGIAGGSGRPTLEGRWLPPLHASFTPTPAGARARWPTHSSPSLTIPMRHSCLWRPAPCAGEHVPSLAGTC